MKFTYDTKQDDRECVAYIQDGYVCVAYIDDCGDLFVKGENKEGNICLTTCGYSFSSAWFKPSEATHKFYPGDKITIEF